MTPEQFEAHMARQAELLEELRAIKRLLIAPVYTVASALSNESDLTRILEARKLVAEGQLESL